MFPQNKEQGAKFKAEVLKMLATPEVRDQLLGMIEQSGDPIRGTAQAIAVLVVKIFNSIPDQEINPKFFAVFLKKLTQEMFEMLQASGIITKLPPPEMQAQVVAEAGRMADEMLQAPPQEQAQQAPGPPQPQPGPAGPPGALAAPAQAGVTAPPPMLGGM